MRYKKLLRQELHLRNFMLALLYQEQLQVDVERVERLFNKALDTWISIQEIVYHVNGIVTKIEPAQQMSFRSCHDCSRSVDNWRTEPQSCPCCGRYQVKASTKSKIAVTISDNTQSTQMTLFDREAQALLHERVENVSQQQARMNICHNIKIRSHYH